MKPSRSPAHTASGHIIVVQEQRFRLKTPDGRVLLLTLANGSNTTMGELSRYAAAGTPLTVHYSGEPTLASGVAHRLEPRSA